MSPVCSFSMLSLSGGEDTRRLVFLLFYFFMQRQHFHWSSDWNRSCFLVSSRRLCLSAPQLPPPLSKLGSAATGNLFRSRQPEGAFSVGATFFFFSFFHFIWLFQSLRTRQHWVTDPNKMDVYEGRGLWHHSVCVFRLLKGLPMADRYCHWSKSGQCVRFDMSWVADSFFYDYFKFSAGLQGQCWSCYIIKGWQDKISSAQ